MAGAILNIASIAKRFQNADEKGWPKIFTCRFIEPGLVNYSEYGTVLINKEALDRMASTFVGRPVIDKNHMDVSPDKFEEQADGVVTRVWFNDLDGWYWCEMMIWDEETKRDCAGGYSVSCAYTVSEWKEGGEHNNIPYTQEVLNGEYTHMAIVANPRYEGAKIFYNAKEKVMKLFTWLKSKKELANSEIIDGAMVDVDGYGEIPMKELIDTWIAEQVEKKTKAELDKQNKKDGKENSDMTDEEKKRKLEEEERKNAEDKEKREREEGLKNAVADGKDFYLHHCKTCNAVTKHHTSSHNCGVCNETHPMEEGHYLAHCEHCNAHTRHHSAKHNCLSCGNINEHMKNEADKKEAEEKKRKEEELKNAADAKQKADEESFNKLKAAANDRKGTLAPPLSMETREDRLERGRKLYGKK